LADHTSPFLYKNAFLTIKKVKKKFFFADLRVTFFSEFIVHVNILNSLFYKILYIPVFECLVMYVKLLRVTPNFETSHSHFWLCSGR